MSIIDLVINLLINFNLNTLEFSYFALALTKIIPQFDNLEEDLDMTAFAIKKLLNSTYSIPDELEIKYAFQLKNKFSTWLNYQKDFSFCCFNIREVNEMTNILENSDFTKLLGSNIKKLESVFTKQYINAKNNSSNAIKTVNFLGDRNNTEGMCLSMLKQYKRSSFTAGSFIIPKEAEDK